MSERTSSRKLARPTKVPRPVNGDTSKKDRRRASTAGTSRKTAMTAMEGKRRAYGRIRPGNLPSIAGAAPRLLVDRFVLARELVPPAPRLGGAPLGGGPPRQSPSTRRRARR